jgi:hypothetical protein
VRARSRARQIDCHRDLERARLIAIVISSAPDRMASDRAIGWRLIAIVIASDCGTRSSSAAPVIALDCHRDCHRDCRYEIELVLLPCALREVARRAAAEQASATDCH